MEGFDESVIKLPREKRADWLAQHRVEAIEKLNRDFQKPGFRWKKGDRIVSDIGKGCFAYGASYVRRS